MRKVEDMHLYELQCQKKRKITRKWPATHMGLEIIENNLSIHSKSNELIDDFNTKQRR